MNAKIFWNRVKTIIRQNNTTNEAVSKACDISFNTWRGWSSKGILPGVEHCSLIAKYLNISMDYLINGKERNSEATIAEIQVLLKRINDKISVLK